MVVSLVIHTQLDGFRFKLALVSMNIKTKFCNSIIFYFFYIYIYIYILVNYFMFLYKVKD